MQLRLTFHRWRLAEPFVIARESIDEVPVLQAELRDRAGHRGRSEAVGIDYEGETPASMAGQVEGLRGWLEGMDL